MERMMRGAKEEEKMMSPMFPRLHVNDTEKGGPRAPPRNKMALYEQLSIPTQKLSSGSAASMLPPPPNNNACTLLPSMSSTHVNAYERSVFTPFCNSPAPSHSEKSLSHSYSGIKPSSKLANQERKSINCTNVQSLNTMQPLSSSAKCNSFQSQNFSNFKNFSWKKNDNENDFRVSGSAQPGTVLHPNVSQQTKDRENRSFWNLSFSMRFQNISEKQKKGTGITDLKARESMRDRTEEHKNTSQDKATADSLCSPSEKVQRTDSLKRVHPSAYQEHRSGSANVLKSLHGSNAQLDRHSVATQDKMIRKDKLGMESTEGIGKENASKGRSEPYSRFALADDNRSRNIIENGKENNDDQQSGSLQVANVGRHDNVLETSMVEIISGLDICPDDVVRAIGEKQFWKARTAIVNQQRAFGVQLFELHRLIKVQKLIAGSPDLLLEDKIYLGKASLKASQAKRVSSDYVIEQLPLIAQPKDSSQKLCPSIEFADESTVLKLPLPSVNNEASKGLRSQQSNHGSHLGSAMPAPAATNTRPSPWCFPPSGNQWLVPVMSPSEGLVYKPYSGSCPPTSGFMTPVYGNCTPMSLTGGGGDFMNPAFCLPASHQQGLGILASNPHLGQTYFPPYGMQVMTSSVSGSAVEQVSPFTGHLSKDNQLSVGDFNFTFPQQSSCNMSSQMSHVVSRRVEKFQASKESEVQGSTASSPCERPKGDALPLFPTEPTAHASDQNGQTYEQQTRAIKVVPHNPRFATESAARIFRSIQEERQQYD